MKNRAAPLESCRRNGLSPNRMDSFDKNKLNPFNKIGFPTGTDRPSPRLAPRCLRSRLPSRLPSPTGNGLETYNRMDSFDSKKKSVQRCCIRNWNGSTESAAGSSLSSKSTSESTTESDWKRIGQLQADSLFRETVRPFNWMLDPSLLCSKSDRNAMEIISTR